MSIEQTTRAAQRAAAVTQLAALNRSRGAVRDYLTASHGCPLWDGREDHPIEEALREILGYTAQVAETLGLEL